MGWLREHREELLNSIRDGEYEPNPVRRKEIPKPEGSGMRKLGIPTVVDRVIQQAKEEMAEILTHAAFYTGWPKAWAAFRMAKEVYVEE